MANNLQIIGSVTSPYTRMIRILCTELNIPFEFQQTAPFGRNTPQQLALIRGRNPLGKVPSIILASGEELIESRVIANYLLRMHPHQANSDFNHRFPFDVATENFCSVAYGVIDAGIMRFMLSKNDPTLDLKRGYLPRFQDILDTGMTWINNHIAQHSIGSQLAFPHIILLSGLDWFTRRQVFDWSTLPQIAALHHRYAERPSVASTRIPTDI